MEIPLELAGRQIEREQIAKWEKDLDDEKRIIRAEAKKKIVALLKNKELAEWASKNNIKDVALPMKPVAAPPQRRAMDWVRSG